MRKDVELGSALIQNCRRALRDSHICQYVTDPRGGREEREERKEKRAG